LLFNVSLGLSLGKVLFALVYPYEKITPWEGLLHDVKATKELAKSKSLLAPGIKSVTTGSRPCTPSTRLSFYPASRESMCNQDG